MRGIRLIVGGRGRVAGGGCRLLARARARRPRSRWSPGSAATATSTAEDDSISLLDAFYYSTVTITTTGYGDVRPVIRRGATADDDRRHPGPGPVPDPARRHDLGDTGRASRHAVPRAAMEEALARPHDHLRLRDQGPTARRRRCAGAGSRTERIVVIDPHRRQPACAADERRARGDLRRRLDRRDARRGRDRRGGVRRGRGRSRRHRDPDHADRARAQSEGDDRRRGPRGGERPSAPPGWGRRWTSASRTRSRS